MAKPAKPTPKPAPIKARPTAPAPKYLGPPDKSSGLGNKPIHRIVIHSTVSDCKPGGARAIAAYFRSSSAGGSAHYIVDPAEVIQSGYDDLICWHAPPNTHSLGVELCDRPDPSSKARWRDDNHRAMLERAAHLTAQLCAAYGVPPVYVDVAGLAAGRHGITTHADVSKAFKQSTHWDPGAWPRRRFMRKVRRYYRQEMK